MDFSQIMVLNISMSRLPILAASDLRYRVNKHTTAGNNPDSRDSRRRS